VVEAYRAKVNAERHQQQQQQQQQAREPHPHHLTVENDASYKRAESDYSIDTLSQLFNAGDDAAPRCDKHFSHHSNCSRRPILSLMRYRQMPTPFDVHGPRGLRKMAAKYFEQRYQISRK